MIYADTDFFISMLKENDWLKSSAVKMHKKYCGRIATHAITVLEVALIYNKKGVDIRNAVDAIFRIAVVEGISRDEAHAAIELILEKKLTTFDAFHAVLSGDRPILSSDKVYDRIGRERIPLEQK